MKLNDKLRIAVVCALATSAIAAYKVQTVPEMVKAANNLLVTLSPDQKTKMKYDFTSSERTNFHFTPGPWNGVSRKGLPLKDMRPEQAKLAHALLATAVSQAGYIKATTIMSLEQILKDREAGGRGNLVRDPDGYFFSVFGDPSETALWGFKVEGHHVALNFTIANGKVISDNPAFMGADPAEVKEGPRTGLRVLGREEDLGRQLVQSLDAQQKAVAVVTTAPRDILTGENVALDMIPNFDVHKPTGIAASKLTTKQVETLTALIEEYAYRMPLELAEVTMSEIKRPNLNNVYFTWAGGLNRGELHYYRVHGPSFLIEFNNTQGGGNHVHSVWRDLKNDFGGDLLKDHLRTAHAN